ncbi:hypothetical protein BDZ91DRAFT_841274 [Kalaharituber pfeilii]|nr:hypothetical protein BDZ91DRAFT_841274 [Kalaharituber pfeilii]
MCPHAENNRVFFDAKNATSAAEVDGLRRTTDSYQQTPFHAADAAQLAQLNRYEVPLDGGISAAFHRIWQNELNFIGPIRWQEIWQNELNLTGPTRWHQMWQYELNDRSISTAREVVEFSPIWQVVRGCNLRRDENVREE